MSRVSREILAEIEWDEGLSMPVANVENKSLENEVKKKQTLLVRCQNELAETEERIGAMSEHLKNVRQELQYTQGVVNARQKEAQTENHMLKIAEREEGRLNQEIARLMKEMDELKERKNTFENKIFKQTQNLETVKAQMNWDQETLEAWLEESTKKDEDAMTLQKYTRQDEGKIKELTCRMEKLMEEATKKRHQLHLEITTTITSQIELDKTAEDFRRAHIEREELLSQWENIVEQMQRRDQEMDLLAAKLATAKQTIRNNNDVISEKLLFLDHEKENNIEYEKKISAAERQSAQVRMELLQAEQQKLQFENETNTLKRTVDRTALDLELTRAAVNHLKKDISDKNAKLQYAKNLRETLVEKLKSAVNTTLTAGEKATQMEDMLLAEERKQEALSVQMKRIGDALYRKGKELSDTRTTEKMTEAAINGAQNAIKNLASKLSRLDADALKQQEILYSQDFTLQQLERRCNRMQGEHNTEEKANLEHTVAELQKNLDSKTQIHTLLTVQLKKVQEYTHRTIQASSVSQAENKDMISRIEELNLYNDNAEAELNRSIQRKQNLMVDENLLKLKIKKLQDLLNSKADGIMSLEKRKLQLNTAMKERQLEIKIHKEMLQAQIKATDEERQQINAELHERISKIDKMRKRYEIYTVSMAPPEGEEERSQAYYVIKAAQEKEELQREGDDLDARIRKAEKEIRALENTLKLMNGRNEQYRKSFNKITDGSNEMEEKHQLEEQFRAVMDKFKYKRRQIQELEDDLHTMSTTLDNLTKDEEAYLAAIDYKKNRVLQFNKEIEDQMNKIDRVAKQNVRMSKGLKAERKLKDELLEEKDFRVKELRDFIKTIVKVIGDAASQDSEMSDAAQLYFSQANLTLPSARGGPAGSLQGSSRGSTASSSRSTTRPSPVNLTVFSSSSSTVSSAQSQRVSEPPV
ncbi:hypothetical protein BsWGS_09257 [Bradybaena similaris]